MKAYYFNQKTNKNNNNIWKNGKKIYPSAPPTNKNFFLIYALAKAFLMCFLGLTNLFFLSSLFSFLTLSITS